MHNKPMNIEIERKYKTKKKDLLRSKLITLGAKSEGIKYSEDIYFKVPQKIESTKYLRIRTKGKNKNGTLAYHEVVSDFETKEWEVNVEDAEMTQNILTKLGFSLDVVVTKERETLKLNRCEVVLDNVKNLGDFIEIEAPNKDKFEELANDLNLDEKDIISGAGYPDLLKNKNA